MEVLRAVGGFEIVGLVDPRADLHGQTLLGAPVLGDDSLLPSIVAGGVRHAFVGVGTGTLPTVRIRLFDLATERGLQVVDAVHPSAVVSSTATLGRGVTIMPGAVVNADARLGMNVVVNSGAIVEHDCALGDHVHVATGARLAGGVRVGNGSQIGIGAIVLPGVTIGQGATIGAGAVVVDDVPDGVLAVGVPARVVRRVDDRTL